MTCRVAEAALILIFVFMPSPGLEATFFVSFVACLLFGAKQV
jgi:hypothetical protein